MKKVYDDPNLNIGKGDFERPLKELSIEVDCDRYNLGDAPTEEEIDNIEF